MISEGGVEARKGGGNIYFGSTLISIDLDRAELDISREEEDLEALVRAIGKSVMFRVKLMRMARLEAERKCAGFMIQEMYVHTEFKIEDRQLLVDINVECPLAEIKRKTGGQKEGNQ